MGDITGPVIVRQYSLESNRVRRNTMTGKDLREDLPVSIVLPGEIQTKLSDLGGYEEAKLEVIEYVNFINHQERYKELGARLPKGALLNGPPGTGKTLLARATAGAANIPYIGVSSGSLLLGSEGPAKLRRIFQLAYSMAPCVLFFDEIDCIGRSRSHHLSKPEHQSLIEEMLVQLDGFYSHDRQLIILASTNVMCTLDSALTRPGRFDRVIRMPPPDLPTRVQILQIHLKPIHTSLDKALLAKRFGILTAGMTGAQIASMCNDAAMIAGRDLNEEVLMEHFEQALDRVLTGIKKKKALSDEEKLRAAHHDAAHAVAGWFLEEGSPPTKLCILPNADGEICCSLDKIGTPALRKPAAVNMLVMALAGAASEEMFHGEYYTRCSRDFEIATEFALFLVAQCGYPESLGRVYMGSTHEFWGDDLGDLGNFKFNPGTVALDKTFEEMKKLLDDCYKKAMSILKEKKNEVEKVSQLLLSKSLVTLDMLVDVLGPSPHVDMEKLSLADVDFLPSGMKSWNTRED